MEYSGQISMETVAVIGLLMVMFAVSLAISANISAHAGILETKYSESNYCNRIALLINSLYNAGPFTQMTISLERDFNIVGQEILVGHNSCFFIGNAEPANLVAGTAVFKNLDGNVVVQNV